MTELQRLQALELGLDDYGYIVPRIINVTGVQGAWFDIDEDEAKSDYDRFLVHQSLVKPPLSRIEEEFNEYKQELIDAENARLAEIARVQDIKDRYKALKDVRGAISKLNIDIKNPAKELERIIKENDQDLLSSLETADAEFESEMVENKRKDDLLVLGNNVKKMCDDAIAIIIAHNVNRSLTKGQQNQLKQDFKEIFDFLKDYQPSQAVPLIQAIIPDGTLVTEQMKSDVLGVFGL